MKLRFSAHKIILSIIPYSFIYSVRKKISLNYFLFGKAKKDVGHYLVNDDQTSFPLYNMENKLGAEVVNGFQSCYNDYLASKSLLRKYVLAVDDCIIEPQRGWAIISSNNTLVFDSVSNNAWREAYHPSYFKYIKNKAKAIHYAALISINIIGGGDSNYWHFLHDLLGQVALAKRMLPGGIPFLISKNLFEKPFFKEALLRSDYMAKCTWLLRDNKYYKGDKVYFIQTMPNSNEQFFEVRKLLQIEDSDATKQRKIFLKRNTNRIRFINNNNEVEAIARQYHFEIVDADNLSLQEQIMLFGQTRYLAGVHGAGLTNVLFRKNAPLHLLELLPKDYLQPHYFWLSKGLGHTYSCLVGSSSKYNTSFYVDPKKFEGKLLQMLKVFVIIIIFYSV